MLPWSGATRNRLVENIVGGRKGLLDDDSCTFIWSTRCVTMGLLTILKKLKEKEKEVRLLVLGLDNAGKTTILKKFKGEDIETISPTLGFDIQTFDFRGYKLNVWDVGGQTTIRSYWRNYFEQTDGLIWVVDSGDKQRLQDCKKELQNLLKQEKLAGASLQIFCNK